MPVRRSAGLFLDSFVTGPYCSPQQIIALRQKEYQNVNLAFADAFGRGLLNSPKALGDAALEGGRGAAIAAARALDRVKAPSHRLVEIGLKANAVAHESLVRLVENQRQVIDGLMDESVRRLELLAQAESLRTLVSEQIEMLADTRTRFGDDTRRMLTILADTRAQLNELFSSVPAKVAAQGATQPTRTATVRPRKPAVARKRAVKRGPRRSSR